MTNSTRSVFSSDDPSIVWACPGGGAKGCGTRDDPFTSVSHAISRARPGSTVALLNGRYRGDVTVQVSGTVERPIRIAGAGDGVAEIFEGCWYFYDTSDLILSDLVFRNSPHGAVSVVGACRRNSFRSLHFANCSTREGSCTMFFGGSGARCNIVEECVFEAAPGNGKTVTDVRQQTIGIMVSEGDPADRRTLNRDHVFRRNTIRNYGCGVLIGSRGSGDTLHGHIVENNSIADCAGDGIRVKCGDTMLRANVVAGCRGSAIALSLGESSTIADNRIERCTTGIRVLGPGHTLRNNCILSCLRESVRIAADAEDGAAPASNIILENNTCVQAEPGMDMREPMGIRIEPGTSCVVRRNLFAGRGMPYAVGAGSRAPRAVLVKDNLHSGGSSAAEGCAAGEVSFADPDADNYENDSAYGAHGWMARGRQMIAGCADTEGYREAEMEHAGSRPGVADALVQDIDRRELLTRSMFYGGEIDAGGNLHEPPDSD
ncbi:MAG: hypothetical protein GF418_14685 [Chitinivibrionales bacterium]|nr:hypothetical protein [Chitinivibrionales bacterium]MBD3396866.1 hypothetical protein [Chitinivibrionales bacterium]